MLCIQRQEVENSCNGKCFLKKELKEDSNKNQDGVNLIKQLSDNLLFSEDGRSSLSYSRPNLNYQKKIFESDLQFSGYLSRLFIPPRFV